MWRRGLIAVVRGRWSGGGGAGGRGAAGEQVRQRRTYDVHGPASSPASSPRPPPGPARRTARSARRRRWRRRGRGRRRPRAKRSTAARACAASPTSQGSGCAPRAELGGERLERRRRARGQPDGGAAGRERPRQRAADARARRRSRGRAWSPSIAARGLRRYDGPMAHDHATVAEEEYLQTIFWLQEAGLPMTGANVARAMQLSAPTVHEMIGRLERDGYITRGEDKSLDFTPNGPRARRGRRPPPPADRALPHRRPRHPVGRGPRGGRAPRARDVAGARGAHARRDRRRQDLPARPPDPARRRASAACRWPTSRRARRSGCCASRTRPRTCCTCSRRRASSRAATASSPAATTSHVTVDFGGATATLTRSVSETVSVIADPSPPPRTALPEQLVLSKDRYGR